MTQLPLPPPVPSKDPQQDRWFVLLWKRVNSAGQILWSYLDFGGSDLADLEKRSYHDLQDKPPIPVLSFDDGLDEAFVIPGPKGEQGIQGERGPAMYLGDAPEPEEYPMPWEGIRSSETFIGAQVENGVSDRSQSTLSFDNGTRTFTITPVGSGFELWSFATRVYVDSPRSVTITNTEGLWFFYFDKFGVLTAQSGFDPTLITQKGWVAMVYWDATNAEHILLADERHGRVMDTQTHLYLHNTRHTVFQTGLALADFDVDGSGNDASAAQFLCSGGTIWDEDIELTIVDGSPQTLSPIAQIPVYYRDGAAGNWRRLAPSDYPLAYGNVGSRAEWNQLTGGAWQLTEVGTNNFVLMHYFATNDVGTNQVIGIVGQSEYATQGTARDGAEVELASLVLSGLPTLEFLPIATVIFQTANSYSNTPKSRVRSTGTGEDYIDWRAVSVVSIGGGGVVWGTITGTLSSQTDLQVALTRGLIFAAAHG